MRTVGSVIFALFSVLFVACAPAAPVDSTPDVAVADASREAGERDADAAPLLSLVDATTATSDVVADAALPRLASDPRCDSLEEIAAEPNRVRAASGLLTYERGALRPTSNDQCLACSLGVPNTDKDVTVKFTAPRAGRWRLTARGVGLGQMRVRRGCALDGFSLQDQGAVRGADLSVRFSRELEIQEGETYEVTLDGCTNEASCVWSVVAERWSDLACPAGTDAPVVCGADQRCVVDPASRARFLCVEERSLDRALSFDVRSFELLENRADGTFLARGQLANGAAGRLGVALRAWRLADGTRVVSPRDFHWIGELEVLGGRITPQTLVLPAPGAVSAEVTLSNYRVHVDRSISFGAWLRATAGQPCAPGSLELMCATGLRCDTSTQRCVETAALEITNLRAWRVRPTSLAVRVEAIADAAAAPRATVEVRDGAGAWRPSMYPLYINERPSPLHAVALEQSVSIDAGPATEARLTLVDAAGRSASRVVAIEPVRVVGFAEQCDAIDTACEAGLSCAWAGLHRQCRPAPQQSDACDLSRAEASFGWVPSQDESVISGRGYNGLLGEALGGCQQEASAGDRAAVVLFEAPVDGRYRFESDNIAELRFIESCEQRQCFSGGYSNVIVIERDLRAGERALLRFLLLPRVGQFSLRVTRAAR